MASSPTPRLSTSTVERTSPLTQTHPKPYIYMCHMGPTPLYVGTRCGTKTKHSAIPEGGKCFVNKRIRYHEASSPMVPRSTSNGEQTPPATQTHPISHMCHEGPTPLYMGVDGWLIEPKTPEFHEIRKGMIGRFHDQ